MWKLNYDDCNVEPLTSSYSQIPISQNECQAHAFEANHLEWDTERGKESPYLVPCIAKFPFKAEIRIIGKRYYATV